MAKKQKYDSTEPTIFDELKVVYKEKLNAAEKQLKNAEKQVASDEIALANCRASNEKPELEQDLRDSRKILNDIVAQKNAILAELKDLEK